MRAIIKATEEEGSVKLADMPMPEPAAGEVLVRIKSASLCYSDVSIIHNSYVGRKPVPVPLILGHEGAGEIAELGTGVTGYEIGERVALEPITGCGRCDMCQMGFPTMCMDWDHIGITCHGTFAEYVAVPAWQAHRIPDAVSFTEAALIEPLALVVRSLEQSKPMLGDTVAVIGPGALGMMHVLAYKAAGAAKVIAVGLDQDLARLKIAKELGADGIINISREDPAASVKAITGRAGVDIVVETASSPKATQLAFDLVGARGRVVLFGLYPEATFSPVKMLRNGVTVFGDVGAIPRQFVTSMRWMESGKVKVRDLITAFKPEHYKEALEAARKGETVKVVFEF
jgi:threonine dehydrogenase-like Zn-dependent dehydrogenase